MSLGDKFHTKWYTRKTRYRTVKKHSAIIWIVGFYKRVIRRVQMTKEEKNTSPNTPQ